MHWRILTAVILAATLNLADSDSVRADGELTAREAAYRKYLDLPSYVKGGWVTPHWMADGSSFCYAEATENGTVIWKVEPEANRKDELFDVAKLRNIVTQELGHEPHQKGVPFNDFTFQNDQETAVRFSLEGQLFELGLTDYDIKKVAATPTQKPAPSPRKIGRGIYPDISEVPSPDRKWYLGLKDYNLYLRPAKADTLVWLTNDGAENYESGSLPYRFRPAWSPVGRKIVVVRRDFRQAPKVPIVDYLSRKTQVEWGEVEWRDPENRRAIEMYIIDVVTKERIKVTTGEESDALIFAGWNTDGTEFFCLEGTYARKIRFSAVNLENGAVREILREEYGAPIPGRPVTLLADGRHFIWHWDRDGWKHLFLYDLNGKLVCPLTHGVFPVERIVTIDDERGWVYFFARPDRSRPYDTHLCRVDTKGNGFQQLTEATGQHTDIQFSPSKQFFLDSHSTVIRPTSVDLRRADGQLVMKALAKVNTAQLEEVNWKPPEEFVVKGADGITDLHGILYKPHDFDPTRKYPVIESIFGGGSMVPRSFLGERGHYDSVAEAMAQLGFIVYIVDGRGPWIRGHRGREFEEMTWGTFGRHEIPDHVAALRNLAKKRPYMDLKRVGVTGGSMGGYFAVRAMLQAPETYHVGVAVAPVIDVATHSNQVWLGPPEQNSNEYEFSSNLRLADQLKGKLLLIQGTADLSVPMAHTMKMADALIRAGKPFDMLVIPDWGHWGDERVDSYVTDRTSEYLVEHLKP